MPRLTLITATALALALPATAQALTPSQQVDATMRAAMSQMAEVPSATGVDEDNLSVAELLARYDRGERLYIGCGTQARVVMALLWRQGIRSRLVATLSAFGPFDHQGDGHTFMEVLVGQRWIAYDPDFNRQPVDARGRAIGAVATVYRRPFHWRFLAADRYSESTPYTWEQLDQVVDHVLGLLAIQISPAFVFAYRGTPAEMARVQSFPYPWVPLGKERWAKLTRAEAGVRQHPPHGSHKP